MRAPHPPRAAARTAGGTDRPLDRLDRLVVLVGDVAFPGAALEELGSFGQRQPVAEAGSARVLGRRLSVRAGRDGLLGGDGREHEHSLGVAGRLGGMCQTREISASVRRRAKCVQYRPVQIDAVVRVDRFLDDQARQLVPECDRIAFGPENPGRLTLLQGIERLAGDRLEEPELVRWGTMATASRSVRAFGSRQRSREDRVADRGRYLAAPALKDLGNEERVARRFRVQIRRVDAVRGGKLLDCFRRERIEAEADDAGGRRQVAEGDAKRMRPLQLVGPVGDYNERAELLDPPSEQAEEVERCVVGPVDVLDDDDGLIPGAQFVDERRECRPRVLACRDDLLEASADLRSDVDERSERARSTQPVAPADQDPRVFCALGEKVRTREVLPIPASPATKTIRPFPCRVAANASSSLANAASRSSSAEPGTCEATRNPSMASSCLLRHTRATQQRWGVKRCRC